mmetsp:Transcript_76538/g.216622  ORF Transcript_76538/g.216622 Transcript_76538/m.216622 type:complete len:142 (-) Transcript_76538:122-547(-)
MARHLCVASILLSTLVACSADIAPLTSPARPCVALGGSCRASAGACLQGETAAPMREARCPPDEGQGQVCCVPADKAQLELQESFAVGDGPAVAEHDFRIHWMDVACITGVSLLAFGLFRLVRPRARHHSGLLEGEPDEAQ